MSAPESTDFAKVFAPFDLLMQAKRGPAAYYVPLLRADDEIVRFGALCQALTLGVLPPERAEDAIAQSGYLAIKQRAFDFFKSKLNHAAAERVAVTPVADPDPALSQAMLASLRSDYAGLVASGAERFRVSGSFEPTVRGVLAFMGADWDEQVAGFADAAHDKAAMTPSYQKIRRGLSLGVQTYWQNYRFLFDGPEAAPLRRWAMHFGYPVD